MRCVLEACVTILPLTARRGGLILGTDMLGAIAGDIIGSVYEFNNVKTTAFPLFGRDSTFTDDSVLTLAVADCVLHGLDFAQTIRRYALRYPDRGYGGMFRQWMVSDELGPYHSFGNGSAMRVSAVGFAGLSADDVLAKARLSAAVTHDHPEGIKGAQAVALAIFLARTQRDKALIRETIRDRFGYDLGRTLDAIRPGYHFDETCQGSVPEAIIAFLESSSYEDAVRKAVSLGGDSDTIACIAGGIAQAYYGGVPEPIAVEVRRRLPHELLALLDEFTLKFCQWVKAATRSSWKNEPMPSECKAIPYSAEFTGEDFERISGGLIPVDMEDKWFIYLEGNVLNFHRSWTGACVYKVEFAAEGDKRKVVRALARRDQKDIPYDDAYDAKLLQFLVSNLLLGKRIPFPRPPGVPQETPPGLIQHGFSGTAYPESSHERR